MSYADSCHWFVLQTRYIRSSSVEFDRLKAHRIVHEKAIVQIKGVVGSVVYKAE